MNKARKFSL